jgi:hypothetical protein
MSPSLPRTITAQKTDPFGWIGIFAAEQMSTFLHQTEDDGQLSNAATLLRHCLPELEHRIESLCPVGLQPTLDGLHTLYGFPSTAGFPVVVSVIHFDQYQPVASVSGTVHTGAISRAAGLRAPSGRTLSPPLWPASGIPPATSWPPD